MASHSDILFGRVVVKNGLATSAQVMACLRVARGRTLDEVMVEQGLLSTDQARQAQRAQALMQFVRAERIFAKILVERRLVDARTVRRAFNVQKERNYKVRLAALMTEGGLLDTNTVEEVVDEQLMRLAEETAKLEDGGFEALVESNENEDFGPTTPGVDSSAMKHAVGPSGLLDAPRFKRTVEFQAAAEPEADNKPRKRTLIMQRRPVSGRQAASSGRSPQPKRKPKQQLKELPAAAPAASPDELIGSVIASRYRVIEKVGEGGMGTVYRAEHCLMEKIVALKLLHPDLVKSAESLDQFRLEIRAASRFQHKNVIQIYDAGEGEGGIFYMAMEFADGETLEEIIEREGAFPLEKALDYFRQMAGAVGEAHKKNIVHRDLKSGNVMVVKDKHGNDLTKVMDFGIAKISFDESSVGDGLYRTQEGIVTGTPQYMSPEQASGEAVDHRSDLYSLGVIGFELLTGQLPFRSDTPMGFLGKHIVEPPPRPTAVRPDLPIPTVVEEVVLRLLEKNPADRYQNAGEILADLDMRCSGEALLAASASASAALRRSPQPTLPSTPVVNPQTLRESPRQPQRVAPRAATPARHASLPPQQHSAHRKGGTIATPPPQVGGGTPRRSPWLIAGLAVGLLVVISITTTVVLAVLGGSPETPQIVDAETVSKAQALVDEGRYDEAIELLEASGTLEPKSDAGELAERAKLLKTVARQIARADELVAQFDMGTGGRVVAERALASYEKALEHFPKDEALKGKVKRLSNRLAGKPAPTPSATPKASTSPPKPGRSRGEAEIANARLLLHQGDLEGAAEAIARATKLLPQGDPKLEAVRAQQGAEVKGKRGEAAAKDGRLKEARELLIAAAKEHPDGTRRRAFAYTLKQVETKIAREQAKSGKEAAMAAALEHALTLDVAMATTALEKLAKDPAAQKRKRGVEALADFSEDWKQGRAEVKALVALKQGDPARAQRAEKGLEKLRPLLTKDFPDADLAKALISRLNLDVAGAKEQVTRHKAMLEQNKSLSLRRFEKALAEYKASSKPEKETSEIAAQRKSTITDLTYHGAYRDEEVSKADRAYVQSEVARWGQRQKVWSELRLAKGGHFVQIPGGKWTPPGRKAVTLPARIYVSPHELTVAEWSLYLRATRKPHPSVWPDDSRQPVRTITLGEAKAYCRWLNRKSEHVRFVVPTEDQWERAARGPKGTAYPWGDAFEKWREGYAAVDGAEIRAVGSFRKDKNGYGLTDFVGNVHELTSTSRDGKIMACGGSSASKKKDSGAAARVLFTRGKESKPTVGVRIFAFEK